MPDYLQCLAVILVLATGVFLIAKTSACAVACEAKDFGRRRNLWLTLTATVFLAHDFWLYMFLAAALLLFALRSEQNRLAMYFFLLFALPNVSAEIPGMGIMLDYLRLLALALLLPTYLSLRRQSGTEPFGRLLADKLVAGFLILSLVQMLGYGPLGAAFRKGVVYAFTDVFLPYYVASRCLRKIEQFRDALMSFAVAGLTLSAILFFEYARYWLLYASVDQALGVVWHWGDYVPRAGDLRAVGSVGHPIVAGYVIAVAMAFFLYMRRLVPNRLAWGLGMLLMIAGLIAPLSRGPWVGAAGVVLAFIATGPAPAVGLARLAGLGLVSVPVLLATGVGEKIIDYLPFVGKIEAGNVLFRQRLAEVSFQVFMQNPLLGTYDFVETPAMQALKGPDGQVDLVNTYVIVGLGGGLVGLLLFVGFFLAAGFAVYGAMRTFTDKKDERYALGQTLVAALVGILLIIGTVSPVLVIPAIYWSVAGLCIAYGRMLARQPLPEEARRKMHGFRP